ncbi:Lrp/AsnC family transcriptional regulator [Brevibacillus humidisoli]|uniref:Lrp/AsnC family transcriptional regulator n=1 Tax=Brevibacillus humidisoli TaxID=2895522 RepID=UPI001E396A99|nr:Lrp/AsnC family transcriptional regulator [Brevibacillus humidisoli]UFJ42841.1 Lrp/AsnC family transcriptional regulator [Brevibacillus humidisoli]
MDHIDRQILERLQTDGRISLSQLSKELNLSRPSVAERMRRLQDKGIVEGFTARISRTAIDRGILVLIQIGELKTDGGCFEEYVKTDPDIMECHRVTGGSSYMIKAAVSSMERLEALVDRLIPYGQVNTSIVLSSPVSRRILLPADEHPQP